MVRSRSDADPGETDGVPARGSVAGLSKHIASSQPNNQDRAIFDKAMPRILEDHAHATAARKFHVLRASHIALKRCLAQREHVHS